MIDSSIQASSAVFALSDSFLPAYDAQNGNRITLPPRLLGYITSQFRSHDDEGSIVFLHFVVILVGEGEKNAPSNGSLAYRVGENWPSECIAGIIFVFRNSIDANLLANDKRSYEVL